MLKIGSGKCFYVLGGQPSSPKGGAMLAGLQANPSPLTGVQDQGDGQLKLRDNHVANFAGESNPTSYKNYPKPINPYTKHYRFYMTKTPSQCSTPTKETKHMRSKALARKQNCLEKQLDIHLRTRALARKQSYLEKTIKYSLN